MPTKTPTAGDNHGTGANAAANCAPFETDEMTRLKGRIDSLGSFMTGGLEGKYASSETKSACTSYKL